jgi:hypothetical protein
MTPKMKKAASGDAAFFIFAMVVSDQAALMALTGQVSTQAPQSMQVSPSILCLPLPSAMALTGQLSTQAPQLVQSLLIT